MSKEELKKKIVDVLTEATGTWFDNDHNWEGDPEERDEGFKRHCADALIAAEIGDVKEVEYQVKVLKRALRMTVSKIGYLQFQISTRQECPISIPDIEDEDCEPYVRRAEDELLFEEKKLKGGKR